MTNEEFIESIRLEGEEWRDVVGFEGYYMVSSYGRAATLYRPYVRTDGAHHHSEQRLLKGEIHKTKGRVSYLMFSFRKNGKRIHLSMHRMVATAFIPNPNNYPCIDHIDTNGLNNHVENLRWCTQKMNMNNTITRKVHKSIMDARKGVPNIKLAKAVVQLDMQGNYIKTYDSIADCDRDGFVHAGVCRTCQGKKPQYKGYKWMYLSEYELLINKSKNPNGSERQLSLPF